MRLSWIATPAIAGTLAALAMPAMADASPASATLRAVNSERAQHGLTALHADGRLAKTAKAQSKAIVSSHVFAHDIPGAPDLSARVQGAGYTGHWKAGEVLAWGTGARAKPKAIVNAWMHSTGHRKIILTPGYRKAGTGIVAKAPNGGPGRTYTMNVASK